MIRRDLGYLLSEDIHLVQEENNGRSHEPLRMNDTTKEY